MYTYLYIGSFGTQENHVLVDTGKLQGQTVTNDFFFSIDSVTTVIERESLRGGCTDARVFFCVLGVCTCVCVCEPDLDFLHTWQETTKCSSHFESAVGPCVFVSTHI